MICRGAMVDAAQGSGDVVRARSDAPRMWSVQITAAPNTFCTVTLEWGAGESYHTRELDDRDLPFASALAAEEIRARAEVSQGSVVGSVAPCAGSPEGIVTTAGIATIQSAVSSIQASVMAIGAAVQSLASIPGILTDMADTLDRMAFTRGEIFRASSDTLLLPGVYTDVTGAVDTIGYTTVAFEVRNVGANAVSSVGIHSSYDGSTFIDTPGEISMTIATGGWYGFAQNDTACRLGGASGAPGPLPWRWVKLYARSTAGTSVRAAVIGMRGV